jgi:dimethylaniline monooxygenase (N-oxide forming)
MPRPPSEDVYFGFFKAKHTRKYLENYVDQHSFAGKKLSDRICLSTEVRSVVKSNGKWSVSAKDLTTGQLKNYQASKLMMAAGLSSIPNMPSIPGKETFLGKVFHQNDFGSSHILASSDVKAVTVLGAGKSSADMVYECVKAGKEVSWVLKETNTTGPGFLVDPKGAGPYKNAFEIAATRFAGSLSPSVFVEENWWTRFLHSTSYGLKLTTAFWGFFDKDVKRAANFEREGTSGLEKLIPHTP